MDLKAKGIQYAVLLPDPVDTELTRTVTADHMAFYDVIKDNLFKDSMP